MLSTSHSYYLQVQGQLAICEKDYCDFICWTSLGLYVEPINRDESVFEAIKPALDLFFKEVILPHLVKNRTKAICKVSNEPVHCLCKKEEFGKMTACDNDSCEIIFCILSSCFVPL